MAFLFVNSDELSALMGLSHLQQSAYLLGIRPYMDRETYLVGECSSNCVTSLIT